MQGKVIHFDEHTKQGSIVTDNGTQYSFNQNNWQGVDLPKIGDNVEFSINTSNQVSHVAPISHITPSHGAGNDLNGMSGANNTNPYQVPTTSLSDQKLDEDTTALYAEEANYNMIDWFMKCLRNYANFKGRARRKEYWYFYLIYVILSVVAGVLDTILAGIIGEDLQIIDRIVSLGLLIPTLAVGARRLHDIGKSGWWQLMSFLSIFAWIFIIAWFLSGVMVVVGGIMTAICWIVLIVWLATETKPETNRFGAPAKPM